MLFVSTCPAQLHAGKKQIKSPDADLDQVAMFQALLISRDASVSSEDREAPVKSSVRRTPPCVNPHIFSHSLKNASRHRLLSPPANCVAMHLQHWYQVGSVFLKYSLRAQLFLSLLWGQPRLLPSQSQSSQFTSVFSCPSWGLISTFTTSSFWFQEIFLAAAQARRLSITI